MTDAKPQVMPALHRYTILGAIHRGGMGEILLARVEGAEGFSRKLVLKGLLPGLDDDSVSLELFRREAQLMARLEHPNIVRVVDFTYVNDKPYLAMEFVRGHNLHQVIHRAIAARGHLPAKVAFHVVAEVLRGIHYAHHAQDDDGNPLGIIHRDISPGNVLLSYFGEVKVTDFGIAQAFGTRKLTAPRSIRGKARYAAPELVRGEPATIQSDVYAAGVVLAEALTGEALFDGRTVSQTLIQIVTEPRERTLERIFAGLEEEVPDLRSVLRSALAIRRDERFGTAQAFGDALGHLVKSVGGPVTQAELGDFMQQLFDMPEGSGLPASASSRPLYSPPRRNEEPTPCERVRGRGSSAGRPAGPSLRAAPVPPADDDDDEATLHVRPTDPAPPPAPSDADADEPLEPRQPHPRPASGKGRLQHLFPPLPSGAEVSPAAYFSELVSIPQETAREGSGSVAEEAGERLSEIGWRGWMQSSWVVVLLGMLLGGAAAIIGSLLAISGH